MPTVASGHGLDHPFHLLRRGSTFLRRRPSACPSGSIFHHSAISGTFTLATLLALSVLLTSFAMAQGADVKEELQKASDKVGDAVNELTEVKGGQLWCPAVPGVGTKCPSSSPFHYYRCCGQLNNECCLRLQTWSFILLVGIGVVVAAIVLVSILRCVFCRRN